MIDTHRASPWASAVLFGWVANFMYQGEVPLTEKRTRVPAIDPERVFELLGEDAMIELLEPEVIEQIEHQLQHRGQYRANDVRMLLRILGDLSVDQILGECSKCPNPSRICLA